MNKKFKDNINSVLVIGLAMFFGGVVAAAVISSTRNPEDWPSYYFYWKLIGVISGYIFVTYIEPGGRVTLNYDKKSFSKEESFIYNALAKKSNKILMAIPPLLYIAYDYYIGRSLYSPIEPTVDGYVAAFIIGAGITLFLANGMKYITTWTNIKNAWRK